MEVLITGTGVVSPFGVGTQVLLDGLSSGAVPVSDLDGFETKGRPGFAVTDLDFMGLFGDRRFRRAADVTRFALLSAKEAFESACLDLSEIDAARTAIVVGVSHGAICLSVDFHRGLVEEGPLGASPAAFSDSVLNAPAGTLSLAFSIKGPAHTIVGGAPAGLQALHMGARIIREGRFERCLVVSTEELSERVYEAYYRLGCVADGAPPPFSYSGFLPGEGAASILLESERSAGDRGVEPVAALSVTSSVHLPTGHATGCGEDKVGGHTEGLVKALDRLFCDGGVSGEEIDGVVTCESGTAPSLEEAAGLAVLLPAGTPVRSIKSQVGESFGAASLMAAVVAATSVKEGRLPRAVVEGSPAPEWAWAAIGVGRGERKEDREAATVLVSSTGLLGEGAFAIIRRCVT